MSTSKMINDFLDAMELIADKAASGGDVTVDMEVTDKNNNVYTLKCPGVDDPYTVSSQAKYEIGDRVYVLCRGGVSGSGGKVILSKVVEPEEEEEAPAPKYIEQGQNVLDISGITINFSTNTTATVFNSFNQEQEPALLSEAFLEKLRADNTEEHPSYFGEVWDSRPSYKYCWYNSNKNYSTLLADYKEEDWFKYNDGYYYQIATKGSSGLYCKNRFSQDALIAYTKVHRYLKLSAKFKTDFDGAFFTEEDENKNQLFQNCNFGLRAWLDFDGTLEPFELDVDNMEGFPWDQDGSIVTSVIIESTEEKTLDFSKFNGLNKLEFFVENYPIENDSLITISEISLITVLPAGSITSPIAQVVNLTEDLTVDNAGDAVKLYTVISAPSAPVSASYKWQREGKDGWENVNETASLEMLASEVPAKKTRFKSICTIDEASFEEIIEVKNDNGVEVSGDRAVSSHMVTLTIVANPNNGVTYQWDKFNFAGEKITFAIEEEGKAPNVFQIDALDVDIREEYQGHAYLGDIYLGSTERYVIYQRLKDGISFDHIEEYYQAFQSKDYIPEIESEFEKKEGQLKDTWKTSVAATQYSEAYPYLWNIEKVVASDGSFEWSNFEQSAVWGQDGREEVDRKSYYAIGNSESSVPSGGDDFKEEDGEVNKPDGWQEAWPDPKQGQSVWEVEGIKYNKKDKNETLWRFSAPQLVTYVAKDGVDESGVSLTASGLVFKQSADNEITPDVIHIERNVFGEVTTDPQDNWNFTWESSTNNSDWYPITTTDNKQNIYKNTDDDVYVRSAAVDSQLYIKLTATKGSISYYDQCMITKLVDGTNGTSPVTAVWSNPLMVFSGDENGVVEADEFESSTLHVYEGIVEKTSFILKLKDGSTSTEDSNTRISIEGNQVTYKVINNNGYDFNSSGNINGSIDFVLIYNSKEYPISLPWAKTAKGAKGDSAIALELSNDSTQVNTDVDGNLNLEEDKTLQVKTTATIVEGAGISSGWTFFISPEEMKDGSGNTMVRATITNAGVVTINVSNYWTTTDRLEFTITATKGTTTLSKVFTVTKNKTGADGAAAVIYELLVSPNQWNKANQTTIIPAMTVTKTVGGNTEAVVVPAPPEDSKRFPYYADDNPNNNKVYEYGWVKFQDRGTYTNNYTVGQLVYYKGEYYKIKVVGSIGIYCDEKVTIPYTIKVGNDIWDGTAISATTTFNLYVDSVKVDSETVSMVDNGNNGAPAVIISLSNASGELVTDADGKNGTYGTDALKTTVSVFVGGEDKSSEWSFTCTPQTGVFATSDGYDISDDKRTFEVKQMLDSVDSGSVAFKATNTGYDEQTIVFTVNKKKQGTNGTPGINTATVFLYQRSNNVPALLPINIEYTFADGTITGTLNKWETTIPAVNGNPCYFIQAVAASSDATDTINNWSSPAIYTQDGDTIQTISAFLLTNSNTPEPNKPNGNALGGWRLDYQVLNKDSRYLWRSDCTVTNGIYGIWSDPVLAESYSLKITKVEEKREETTYYYSTSNIDTIPSITVDGANGTITPNEWDITQPTDDGTMILWKAVRLSVKPITYFEDESSIEGASIYSLLSGPIRYGKLSTAIEGFNVVTNDGKTQGGFYALNVGVYDYNGVTKGEVFGKTPNVTYTATAIISLEAQDLVNGKIYVTHSGGQIQKSTKGSTGVIEVNFDLKDYDFYVNASMIKTGILDADLIDVANLQTQKLLVKDANGNTLLDAGATTNTAVQIGGFNVNNSSLSAAQNNDSSVYLGTDRLCLGLNNAYILTRRVETQDTSQTITLQSTYPITIVKFQVSQISGVYTQYLDEFTYVLNEAKNQLILSIPPSEVSGYPSICEIMIKYSCAQSSLTAPPIEGSILASYFEALADGSVFASNANITGKVTAEEGKIGGWQINKDNLSSSGTSPNVVLSNGEQDDILKAGFFSQEDVSTYQIAIEQTITSDQYRPWPGASSDPEDLTFTIQVYVPSYYEGKPFLEYGSIISADTYNLIQVNRKTLEETYIQNALNAPCTCTLYETEENKLVDKSGGEINIFTFALQISFDSLTQFYDFWNHTDSAYRDEFMLKINLSFTLNLTYGYGDKKPSYYTILKQDGELETKQLLIETISVNKINGFSGDVEQGYATFNNFGFNSVRPNIARSAILPIREQNTDFFIYTTHSTYETPTFSLNYNGQVNQQTASINDSDRNIKNSIKPLAIQYEQIFDAIQPISHKFNNNSSNRTHIGVIAQDVEQAVLDAGLTTQDFAAVCYDIDKETGKKKNYGIRYTEFVPLNIWQIQKLKTRVSYLEEENRYIKQKLEELESKLQ